LLAAARAASGHPMADPAIPLTKSRRRIALPKGIQDQRHGAITAGI